MRSTFSLPGNKFSTLSLLATAIGLALTPPLAYAEDTASQTLTVTGKAQTTSDSQPQPDRHRYTVESSRSGTKMNLTDRDIPQSVSVITEQRMKDQDLRTLNDVLKQSPGISSNQSDSERYSYFARGFYINNYSYDDIPVTQDAPWNFGETDDDMAKYQRVDIIRGATGLMSGTGNPSATINLIRKKAESKTFIGDLSTSYGSWNNQRYVADLQGPLNDSGTLRARVISGYQDQNSQLDRYHKISKFFYGDLAADLTDHTTLDLGYDYQQRHTSNPTWGGLPTWFTNGEKTHYSRSTNAAADWTFYNTLARRQFANLVTHFDNGWETHINAMHGETLMDSRLFYLSGFPDQATGILPSTGYGYAGWYKGIRTQTAVDAFATGPFTLFGRQHQLVAGVDYSRQRNRYDYSSAIYSPAQIGNYNQWMGDIAQPDWPAWALSSNDTIRQRSGYVAARFSLTDPLSLVTGMRYTEYTTNGSSAMMQKNNLTPYGGIVYDLTDSLSAYASYTSIFQPQTYRDTTGHYLKPVTGKNYETGLKADWLESRLTSTLSLFRIEQTHLGQAIAGTYVNNSSETAYRAANGVVSRGVEFEVNGAVTDNLAMTFSASRYVAQDSSKDRINPELPQTSFKLFTSYLVPAMPDLTVGGGITWQNATYQDTTDANGNTVRVVRGSYPLADLFARYQVTRQLSVQANVKNLFNRDYYTNLSNYVVYGESRNYSVNLSYHF
ncbi:ferric-rhodotorulic acid/ferric-coprogen receptor FhuE [Rosenbergiella australiborealis]|uniref:ferric-rhodotorulic acid/ferric-coprogen receptor FhuE n=1 Tax=Rosenbergiella australiborealis TaxID=1544696 RepID=UPI001F4EE5E2|nr:ferric-rhodotorulic acid/ferric-coprogen receptor FhuE [Rosenbergiella australiborealis]